MAKKPSGGSNPYANNATGKINAIKKPAGEIPQAESTQGNDLRIKGGR